MRHTVAISGLYSGTDPAPGIGVAQSLRCAFPDLRLIGVDYSGCSTGIAMAEFTEIRLVPDAMRAGTAQGYRQQLADALSDCGLFIPGHDPEARALSSGCGSLLVATPSSAALERASKPNMDVGECLPLNRPPSLHPVDWSDRAHVRAFCHECNWHLWAKSLWYGAARVTDEESLWSEIAELESTWGPRSVWLQQDVAGAAETLAFCALDGELLQAAHLTKTQVTPEGKTWAGTIEALDRETEDGLRGMVRELAWSGGGELELVRDGGGGLSLLEVNPRFPSWMWAATMAGFNLPATLVSRMLNLEPADPRALGGTLGEFRFARVITEVAIPADRPAPGACGYTAGDHPTGMAALARLVAVEE